MNTEFHCLLSLTSMTSTTILNVPDLGGFPPSIAVSCFSRSKALIRTSSTVTLCSTFCTSREKCSLGLSL
uniref:Uncharacterized protein n=1 Tax=Sinocyclocheilus rhinocerous TaxID=307959 RepID=A0A673KI99_9TELE